MPKVLPPAMQELCGLVDRSAAYDVDKHDHVIASRDMTFNDDGLLELAPIGTLGVAPVALTDHATRQLYAKLGPGHFGTGSAKPLPFDYLQQHGPLLRAKLLNYHARQAPVNQRKWLVRCYQYQCRAVLHETYPVIPNTALLRTVLSAIGDTPPAQMRLVRPYVDSDRLLLKLVWADTNRPDGGGGVYGIGTFVGNDEIGSGRVKVWPLVQMTSCTNSLIFRPLDLKIDVGDLAPYDEEADKRGDFIGLSLVHRGDVTRMSLLVKDAIGQSLGAGAEFVERMVRAETQRLPNFTDILAGLAKQYDWSDELKTTVAVGTHGRETVAGLVAGVTYAAQSLEQAAAQIDMEVLGGSILQQGDALFARAAQAARQHAEVRL